MAVFACGPPLLWANNDTFAREAVHADHRYEEELMDNPPPWTDPFCWSTMYEGWTEADDVIEEIRQIRMEISARFDHDIHKYGAYLMERQKRHGDRLVDPRTWRQENSAGRSAVDAAGKTFRSRSGETPDQSGQAVGQSGDLIL